MVGTAERMPRSNFNARAAFAHTPLTAASQSIILYLK
jgi:hypothetical protein